MGMGNYQIILFGTKITDIFCDNNLMLSHVICEPIGLKPIFHGHQFQKLVQ